MNSYEEATAFKYPLGGNASVNEYQELDCPYEEANIYQQIPESKVQRKKSCIRLNINGQRVDDASNLYSHATETVSQTEKKLLDKPPPAVYATVDQNKGSSTNGVYAVVDKGRSKQNE